MAQAQWLLPTCTGTIIQSHKNMLRTAEATPCKVEQSCATEQACLKRTWMPVKDEQDSMHGCPTSWNPMSGVSLRCRRHRLTFSYEYCPASCSRGITWRVRLQRVPLVQQGNGLNGADACIQAPLGLCLANIQSVESTFSSWTSLPTCCRKRYMEQRQRMGRKDLTHFSTT
jgi:hypothetical protein